MKSLQKIFYFFTFCILNLQVLASQKGSPYLSNASDNLTTPTNSLLSSNTTSPGASASNNSNSPSLFCLSGNTTTISPLISFSPVNNRAKNYVAASLLNSANNGAVNTVENNAFTNNADFVALEEQGEKLSRCKTLRAYIDKKNNTIEYYFLKNEIK